MNEESLRKLIREEVETVLDETPRFRGGPQPPPKGFREFRQMFAAGLEAAGAPHDIVSAASDLDYEGGDVFARIWDAWLEVEQSIPRGRFKTMEKEEWHDLVDYAVHDAAVAIAADLIDGVVDPGEFARSVVDWFLTGKTTAQGVVALDADSVIKKIDSALKAAGVKTKIDTKGQRGGALETASLSVLDSLDYAEVQNIVEPAFLKLGFERGDGRLEKKLGRSGYIRIEFGQWEEGDPVDVDVSFSYKTL